MRSEIASYREKCTSCKKKNEKGHIKSILQTRAHAADFIKIRKETFLFGYDQNKHPTSNERNNAEPQVGRFFPCHILPASEGTVILPSRTECAIKKLMRVSPYRNEADASALEEATYFSDKS